MGGKIYMFGDDEHYVYATSLEEAKACFAEETGDDPETYTVEEFPVTAAAYMEEDIFMGGYNSVEFVQLIQWRNLSAPHYFGTPEDIKDLIELAGD